MKFEYYTGMEAEQFAFFRIPRLLVRDKRFSDMSSNAKLLYGLMLDRLSLSMKNGWIDENNRAYIYYSVENIMEELNCAKSTCVRILAELDDKKGIGLIERVRQGQGRPDRIYVKNFATIQTGGDGTGGGCEPNGGTNPGVGDGGANNRTESTKWSGKASGFSCARIQESTDSGTGNKPNIHEGTDSRTGNKPDIHEGTDSRAEDKPDIHEETGIRSDKSQTTGGGQDNKPDMPDEAVSVGMGDEADDACRISGHPGDSSRSSKIGLLEMTEVHMGDRQFPVYSESDFQNVQNENPRSSKIGLLEVAKSNPNYTNINQTDYSQTEGESIHPIDPLHPNLEDADGKRQDADRDDGIDCALRDWDGRMERASPETELRKVRQNIEYDYFLRNLSSDELTIFQEIDHIVRDIIFARGGVFRINGAEYAPEYVRWKVLELNSYHIEYVLECVRERTNVRNIRAYMLTTLINAITTMDHSYQQQIRRESFCGWG